MLRVLFGQHMVRGRTGLYSGTHTEMLEAGAKMRVWYILL